MKSHDYTLQVVIRLPEECTKCKAKLVRTSDVNYMCGQFLLLENKPKDTDGHTFVRLIQR